MLRAKVAAGMMAGCLLIWSVGAMAADPPKAEIFLKYRPKQDGVLCTVPEGKEAEACKVEPEKGKTRGAGWVLRDPQGRVLRRFFDTQYDGKSRTGIDIYSYYHDGVETYREQYINTAAEPDQMHYRWLNEGGTKWGIDLNKDGKIDYWKMISPEEVSQEIVQAVIKNDFARLQALFMTDAELKGLELPPDLAKRVRDGRAAAAAKFADTVKKLGLTDKSRWLHLETEAPHLVPTEGGRDIVLHARGTIVIETAGKNDWIQTGEIVQVGAAWRIIQAPTPGAVDGPAGAPGGDNPELQKLLASLGQLDAEFGKKGDAKPADIVKYNLDRSDLIEQIIAQVKTDDDRAQWLRQEADCLGAAAQSSPVDQKAAYERLAALVAQLEKSQPGNTLTAYVTFREMQAWYSDRLKPENVKFPEVADPWLKRLAKFVKDYPNADDTAEALLAAGWVSEMAGKEAEAKTWYTQLAKDFADTPQGTKAKGAIRRLTLEGSEMALAGPTLDGGTFDLSRLRGKVVIVYYWYSWKGGPVGDFAKLKQLLDTYGKQGLELVTISLDATAKEAAEFVQKTGAPGLHLFQEGGMESKYAVDYGVMMMPSLFLVGKDGKVVNRTLQVGNVEEEVKKQLAK
jgi:peroxiredoxin